MYTIKEQDGWYYLKKDGQQLHAPGGKVVKSMFKDLAERLAEDLEKYGEDPSDPVSLVAFHYAMTAFFLDNPRPMLEHSVEIGLSTDWDWTLANNPPDPHVWMAWVGLFGTPESQIEKGKEWVKSLTMMQLCATTVVGRYFESVNIPYIVATEIVPRKLSLKRFVQRIRKYNPYLDVDNCAKVLENFVFYFNVDKGEDTT